MDPASGFGPTQSRYTALMKWGQLEEASEFVEPEIRLPLAALLPEDYVADVSRRLVLYKQLSATRDTDELDGIRADLLDRFGPLPPETQNLLEVIRLKIR